MNTEQIPAHTVFITRMYISADGGLNKKCRLSGFFYFRQDLGGSATFMVQSAAHKTLELMSVNFLGGQIPGLSSFVGWRRRWWRGGAADVTDGGGGQRCTVATYDTGTHTQA